MNRLIEPPRVGRTIGDFGYNSSSLPRFGGGSSRRLRGIPSYGYDKPISSYKVGSGLVRPSALPSSLTPAGGIVFAGAPGAVGDYTIGQETYDVGGAAKTPSTGAMLGDALKLAAVSTGIGTGLNALGLPTFGMPVVKDLDKIKFGSLFNTGNSAKGLGSAFTSGIGSLGNLIQNTMSQAGPAGVISLNSAAGMSAPGIAGTGVLYDANMNPIQPSFIDGVKSFFGYGPENTANAAVKLNPAYGPQDTGFLSSVGNFFNAPRSFIPGVSGTGASATGFGGGGVPGQGITSIGNVLGTVGGVLSLADFVKDPSLASGLGTLAGAGASGIGAFSGLAPAAPFLALGALAAGLLGIGNKKPSNKTGYASVDFDNLQSQSYSIGDYKRKKMNKENVEFTKKLLDPIIPYIEEIEKKYGFDLKGDLQISYGGRDGLFYNIGDIDQEGLSRRDMFLNRVDYYDGRDQNVYKRRFNTDEAGLTKFYDSILKDLENIAQNKITNLRQYRGIQRQVPQGIFSYGV